MKNLANERLVSSMKVLRNKYSIHKSQFCRNSQMQRLLEARGTYKSRGVRTIEAKELHGGSGVGLSGSSHGADHGASRAQESSSVHSEVCVCLRRAMRARRPSS